MAEDENKKLKRLQQNRENQKYVKNQISLKN